LNVALLQLSLSLSLSLSKIFIKILSAVAHQIQLPKNQGNIS